jgi:hypothetical protein
VGVIFRVLGLSGVFGLIDATMYPVHSDDEDWVVIIIDSWIAMSPALGPDNLVVVQHGGEQAR